MNFGPRVREIRKRKGFSQKEVYANIISKSYAISFEKGENNISVVLLIDILDRLSMDIDEFLFINKGYLLNEYSDYIYNMSNYSNSHDVDSLKRMLQTLSQNNDKMSHVHFAEIRCRIRAIEKFNRTGIFDGTETLEVDRNTIQSYLVNIESWTLREIQFFGNTIEFLDFNAHFPLFKNISKSLSLYMEYDKGREIFCSMLINLISQSIRMSYYDYAEVLTYQLKILSADYKNFIHRIITSYFENLLLVKKHNQSDHASKSCEEVLAILDSYGHSSIANELRSLI